MNRSSYRTPDVLRFVRRGLLGEHAPKGVTVIVTDHPRHTRGCAELFGREMTLALGPRAEREPAQVARILRHEVAHLRGVDHEEMGEALLYSEGACPAWARGLTLRKGSRR